MCNYTVNANDFSDPEGDSLSFDLKVKQVSGMAPYSNVFPWLTFSANKKQISGTPIFADVGTYTLVVQYSDGSNICYQEASFSILNNKPV